MKNAHGRKCKKTKVYISLYENLFVTGCVYIYIYMCDYNFTEVQASRVIMVLLLQNCFVWCKDHTHQATLTTPQSIESSALRNMFYSKNGYIYIYIYIYICMYELKGVHIANFEVHLRSSSVEYCSISNVNSYQFPVNSDAL